MDGDSVNPVQVQKFLDGVDYPASKDDLVNTARNEGADDRVIEALDRLPDQQFNSPVDVSQALGDMGNSSQGNG